MTMKAFGTTWSFPIMLAISSSKAIFNHAADEKNK